MISIESNMELTYRLLADLYMRMMVYNGASWNVAKFPDRSIEQAH